MTLLLVQMNKARREVSQQIKHVTVLRTYLNDWKNILLLFKLQFFVNQVVNLHIVILENLGNYWYIKNIFETHFFATLSPEKS